MPATRCRDAASLTQGRRAVTQTRAGEDEGGGGGGGDGAARRWSVRQVAQRQPRGVCLCGDDKRMAFVERV